jgi:hypothetical protein
MSGSVPDVNYKKKRCRESFPLIRLTDQEHLLSWPFLDKTPEAARIGNRQTTNFICHIQQVFVARDEHIGLGS